MSDCIIVDKNDQIYNVNTLAKSLVEHLTLCPQASTQFHLLI